MFVAIRNSLTRLLLTLMAGSVTWAQAPATVAQELPAEDGVTEQVVSELADHARVAKGTILDALAGDTDAMRALLSVYLGPAVMVLLVLIMGYMIASFFGQLVSSVMAQRVDVMLGRFVGRLITYTIMAMVILGVLGRFGIDVTSFAALLAAAGFALGMALQGSLSNFAAGVMLLVFRPFNVGDYVRVGDSQGTVFELDLFTTRLNTPDNRRLIVPNNEVFGKVIENFTYNETRRVDVKVGVAYAADLRQTRATLENAIALIEGAVSDPAPTVLLDNLGDSSVNWQLRVWCRPENYWAVREAVTAATKEALDAAGIGIPFPQLDLHVVSEGGLVKRAA